MLLAGGQAFIYDLTQRKLLEVEGKWMCWRRILSLLVRLLSRTVIGLVLYDIHKKFFVFMHDLRTSPSSL